MIPPPPSTRGQRIFVILVKLALLLTAFAGYLVMLVWNDLPPDPRKLPPAVLTQAGAKIVLADYNAQKLQEDITATSDKPMVLFIYTSWCPYCHQMFPLVNQAALDHPELRFIAVSTDKDRAAIANYLAEIKPLHLSPVNVSDPNLHLDIINAMNQMDLRYKGGIPYMAVFHKGKSVAEVPGMLEKADFDAMVADIRAATLPDASPNNTKE